MLTSDPEIYFTTDHRWRCCDHPEQLRERKFGIMRHKVWCDRRCQIKHASGYVCILDRFHPEGDCRGYFP